MGFIIEGLDEMTEALNAVQGLYSKEIKKFMQKEGTKLKNRTLKTAKSTVKKKTGNYFKGVKRGKYYKHDGTGADAIHWCSGVSRSLGRTRAYYPDGKQNESLPYI